MWHAVWEPRVMAVLIGTNTLCPNVLLLVVLLVRTSSELWLKFAISWGAFQKILMPRLFLR